MRGLEQVSIAVAQIQALVINQLCLFYFSLRLTKISPSLVEKSLSFSDAEVVQPPACRDFILATPNLDYDGLLWHSTLVQSDYLVNQLYSTHAMNANSYETPIIEISLFFFEFINAPGCQFETSCWI